jgi:hypothetical protein
MAAAVKVTQTFYFGNGNVAVFGPGAVQIPELQGHWDSVWRRVWNASDEDTIFTGWPSTHGDTLIKQALEPELWPSYEAICGARSKGLILGLCESAEGMMPGSTPHVARRKLEAVTDALKSLTVFHDEAVELGMSGAEIMLEWSTIARSAIECSEKLKEGA